VSLSPLIRYSRVDFDSRWSKFVDRLIKSWQLLVIEALQARSDDSPSLSLTLSQHVHELLEHLFARLTASMFMKEEREKERENGERERDRETSLCYQIQYESHYLSLLCDITLLSLSCNMTYVPTLHLVPQIWKFVHSVILSVSPSLSPSLSLSFSHSSSLMTMRDREMERDRTVESMMYFMRHLMEVITLSRDRQSQEVSEIMSL
jgi:hypothetical protein